MASLGERLIGAAKLDVNTYEEVEADTSATPQAMIVVLMSALAAGIGSIGDSGIKGMFVITVAALVGWFIWAGLTYLIGTKMLPEADTQADLGELLRTTGFSQAPGSKPAFWHTASRKASTSMPCSTATWGSKMPPRFGGRSIYRPSRPMTSSPTS